MILYEIHILGLENLFQTIDVADGANALACNYTHRNRWRYIACMHASLILRFGRILLSKSILSFITYAVAESMTIIFLIWFYCKIIINYFRR